MYEQKPFLLHSNRFNTIRPCGWGIIMQHRKYVLLIKKGDYFYVHGVSTHFMVSCIGSIK